MDDLCRICRSEETEEEPLFHPCKCSGSIKYVHQDCLLQWLEHARHDYKCDLCGTPYIFENIYAPDMPASLPLKAYVYKFYTTYQAIAGSALLILRAVVLCSMAAVLTKYLFEIVTMSVTAPMTYRALAARLVANFRKGRAPYFASLDRKFERPWMRELHSAVIDGAVLLVAMSVCVFLVYVSTMWALTDRGLLHDIEHIQHGEPGHMDVEYEQDIDEVLDGDDGVGPERFDEEDEEWIDEAEDDNDEHFPHGGHQHVHEHDHDHQHVHNHDDFGDEDMEDIDDLFMDRDEGEGFFEEGENLWTVFEQVFGGPILPRLGWFSAVMGIMLAGIFTMYQGPLLVGRWTIIGSLQITRWLLRESAVRLEKWQPTLLPVLGRTAAAMTGAERLLPDQLHFHLFSYWLGCVALIYAVHIVYAIRFNVWLTSPGGRATLIVMKQVKAVSRVLGIVVIELTMLPVFCGALLHVSVLPLLADWRITTALRQVMESPMLMACIYWATGLTYMYLLANFIRVSRGFLRPGTLYFVQDPSDPRNEPVRRILRDSWERHSRRVVTSAGIYVALLVGGVGSVSLLFRVFGVIPNQIAPVVLTSSLWSGLWHVSQAALLLFVALKNGKVSREEFSERFGQIWQREIRRGAALLDLDSFLFGESKELPTEPTEGGSATGYFVRAPRSDILPSRYDLELFVPVTPNDERLDGQRGLGRKELRRYTLVWRPAHFGWRLAVLAVLIWQFGTRLTLLSTVLPLTCGRLVNRFAYRDAPVENDLLLYVVGVATLVGLWAVYRSALRPGHVVPTLRDAARTALRVAGLGAISHAVLAAPVKELVLVRSFVRPTDVDALDALVYGCMLTAFGWRLASEPAAIAALCALAAHVRMTVAPEVRVLAKALATLGLAALAGDYAITRFSLAARATEWLQSAREDFFLIGRQLGNMPDPEASTAEIAAGDTVGEAPAAVAS